MSDHIYYVIYATMIRKLSGWLAQSNSKPGSSSSSSLRSPPAPQVQEPRDSDDVDVVDTWAAASLPIDLIIEIFLRLEPAAIFCCAGVCKPWRRAIIANASILGPHLDRFLGPSLLLGVFHCDTTSACLRRTPGPFQSALPSNGGGSNDDPAEVRILAVHRRAEVSIMFLDEETLAYQLFSTSGDRAWVWSPVVQCSGDHLEPRSLCVRMDRRSTAVGRDIVYWLAGPRLEVTWVLALDVRTGRTWTTQLQMECHPSILGMSGDGRLFLVQSLSGPSIKVWVLSGDAQWTLQRTISMATGDVVPWSSISLRAFCPRSWCVVALWSDQELIIDIDCSGSSPRIRQIGKQKACHCRYCPYEMDSSSTYISKMKHFYYLQQHEPNK